MCDLCAHKHNVSLNSNYDVRFNLECAALLGVLLVLHHKETGSVTALVGKEVCG